MPIEKHRLSTNEVTNIEICNSDTSIIHTILPSSIAFKELTNSAAIKNFIVPEKELFFKYILWWVWRNLKMLIVVKQPDVQTSIKTECQRIVKIVSKVVLQHHRFSDSGTWRN